MREEREMSETVGEEREDIVRRDGESRMRGEIEEERETE